jgi:DNA-binding response OmpR family regulator
MLTETDILNARILIVDDQSAHVHLLERLLQDSGYTRVTGTIDPHEACALHRAQPYDLILLDLQMPGLDGFGVMKALRAEAGEAVLPVIALTAQPGHKLRALQAGARDFINKPFDMVEVKLRIHHMLEAHLLYKLLAAHNQALERTVQERTAALEDSEARFRSLTELAADWYWEQNEQGELTRGHGPVLEILGQQSAGALGAWDAAGCQALREKVAARQPFLDFIVHRQGADGSRQEFRVSGEPIFDRMCRVAGYRGVGTEVLPAIPAG